MKLVKTLISNFKKHEQIEVLFEDNFTMIAGGNGQGKTSVLCAIIWCLQGTDERGKKIPDDSYVRRGAESMRVGLYFVSDNGQQISVDRVRENGKTTLYLNGKKSGQNAVEVWLGDTQRFLSAFVPGFFSSLTPKDGRVVLADLLPRLTQEQVVGTLGALDQKALEGCELLDPDKFLTNTRKKLDATNTELSMLKGRLQEAKEYADKELLPPVDVEHVQNAIQTMQNQLTSTIDWKRLEKDLVATQDEYRKTRALVQEVPHEAKCPTCSQDLPQDQLEPIIEEINEKNKIVEEKLQIIAVKGTQLKEQLAKKPEKIVDPDLPEKMAALRARERELLQQQAEVNAHNKLVEDAKQRIQTIQTEIQTKTQLVNLLTAQIRATNNYRVAFAEMQIKPILEHLNRTSIELFDVTKETGEIRPVFHVYWKNPDGNVMEYSKLSLSEKIRCDIEISRMISAVTNTNYPVWVDNAESVQGMSKLNLGTQIIASYVQPGSLVISTARQATA